MSDRGLEHGFSHQWAPLRRVVLWLLLCLFGWLQAAQALAGDRYDFPHGSVTLKDGGDELGLHFQLDEHWHIYWRNSGESGAAPIWQWQVQGGKLGEAQWPAPKRITIEGIINFGYEQQALIRFPLQRAGEQAVQARVELEFLACKIECIPYFTTLEIRSPDRRRGDDYAALTETFVYPQATLLKATFSSPSSQRLAVSLTAPDAGERQLKNLHVFPVNGTRFAAQPADIHPENNNTLTLHLPLQGAIDAPLTGERLLLALEYQDGQQRSYYVALQPDTGPGLLQIMLWALLGGAILNIMPCVFPVLSIKVLSFMGPDRNPARLRRAGWFYTLGIVVSFAALGGLLLALRAAGQEIGWGFQLQSPVFVAAIAVLFFWLALNFLGLFEVGGSLMGLGSQYLAKPERPDHPRSAAFATGVLATVVATPCTAPFMGAALGASLTLPPSLTVAIFVGLGLGMALPFLLLAHFPAALQALPKPGPWMLRFKEFLAFPMLATVLWLLWVLSLQSGSAAVIALLSILTAIGFWVWLASRFNTLRWSLLPAFLASFIALVGLPSQPTAAGPAANTGVWQAYDRRAIAEDIDRGRGVFVDFTAAWCITCQVNKKLVLDTAPVLQAFARNDVALYRADWTDRSPTITAALAEHGRNSLPVYAYYPPGQDRATLLPEVLTQGLVINTVNRPQE